MKITAIHEQSVSLRSSLRNAYINFSEMTVSVVAIVSDVYRQGRPLIGYGFHSNGRYAPSEIIRQRLVPRLLAASPEDLLEDDGANISPVRAWQVMMTNEKPGGHGERAVAVGTVDMALWDLAAKIEEKPLYQLLADRYRGGQADADVYVYAAGGYYYPGKGITGLQDEIKRFLDQGYLDVKIKIGGAPLAEDLQRIEAVLSLLDRRQSLAVDANGRFDLPTALAYAEALTPYRDRIKWYEEAGDPLDFDLNARVAEVSPVPIATGENLFSWQDSRNLIRYGGMKADRDYLQMDPALSYGLVEYLRIIAMLEEHGWSPRRCIPHGGHQLTLHIAAGLGLHGNESYPGVFEPFGGFADHIPVEAGRVRLPDVPGIGIETKAELMKVFAPLTS
ncbi:MAG: enolase C-terminal domain-like protein [Acidobacteriota bacterium]|jgi:L-alanine-DL-glutamate epimerase-like enolase superfamily enzyme